MRLAIDDFGTGYSALAYLKRLPIDVLKIDQSFVRALATDPADATITEMIVKLAAGLNLATIAEGVETLEQLLLLGSFGCKRMQGYLFGKPVPPEIFESGSRTRRSAGSRAPTRRARPKRARTDCRFELDADGVPGVAFRSVPRWRNRPRVKRLRNRGRRPDRRPPVQDLWRDRRGGRGLVRRRGRRDRRPARPQRRRQDHHDQHDPGRAGADLRRGGDRGHRRGPAPVRGARRGRTSPPSMRRCRAT